jgi:hypothetical protein
VATFARHTQIVEAMQQRGKAKQWQKHVEQALPAAHIAVEQSFLEHNRSIFLWDTWMIVLTVTVL